ncbi:MAG: flavin monoamine oxidase family protein [Gammaproteobacteria bacterium]|nr:flavin monoamine oxidase family protein [Gammaproteobacteria bacterium]
MVKANVQRLRGARRRVVILGAGVAGLVAAYELDRAGYDCVVLEASHRPGGRVLTLRGGDIVDEVGHRQVCHFDRDPALYFNAGAARIPADHVALLQYCRELQVPLEVFVNDNRNALVHDDRLFGGRPVRAREFITDARGFVSELLAKSVFSERLSQPFDAPDAERLLDFIRAYGDLDSNHFYRGSSRAGYRQGGFIVPGERKQPLDFTALLHSDFWRYQMHWAESNDQAATMMQPVGGMDAIIDAFMGRVGRLVTLNAIVRRIHLEHQGVRVAYAVNGQEQRLRADYCINSIPTHLTAGLDHNFPRDYVAALRVVERGKLFKIGLQAKERFWEAERIYGGISWTNQDITQIWYPPGGFHSPKGILLGAYTFGDAGGEKFANMTPAQRIDVAIEQGERLHPGYRGYIENGVSVPWHRMNHMLGCSARWRPEDRRLHYARLQQPVGAHYMVGDQISYHPGWQEGAVRSAHFALADIDRRVQADLALQAWN